MGGIYIPDVSMPGDGDFELWIAVKKDGSFDYNVRGAWLSGNQKAVPVPPHGRLRKRIVYRGEVYNALESARVNALDGILSDPYKEGFHDGIKRAIQILANEVDDAPTIILAEEGE